MAGGVPLSAEADQWEEREGNGRRGVPLVFQGGVRWGLVPDRGGDGAIDLVHLQAVACADALEEHLVYQWKGIAEFVRDHDADHGDGDVHEAAVWERGWRAWAAARATYAEAA